MPEISIDLEAKSPLDLTKVGAHRYACHPSTKITCFAYAVDDWPPRVLTADDLHRPPEIIRRAIREGWTFRSFNAPFEIEMWHHKLTLLFNWPEPDISQWRCTMAAALAAALPGSLEKTAQALGLTHQKDMVGRRLMLRLARANYDPTPEELRQLYAYCRKDVESEREASDRLPPLTADEQLIWELDAKINQRGFRIDRELAVAARMLVKEERRAIDGRIAELTDGTITTAHQVARISDYVRNRGHQLKSLTKRSVAAVLAHEPDEETRKVLELRRDGSRASANKLDTLLAGLNDDDRLRGCFRYHGAATGRWSGRFFQPQNLKKRVETPRLDEAIEAVRAGDLERVRTFGAPLTVIGDLSRALITAAPGHDLMGADLSAIESRVLAWIAGETWKLNTYREYDRTGDPKREPYCVTASKILLHKVTPDDEAARELGKTCELAFQYGSGLAGYRAFDPSDNFTDQQVEAFKNEWRDAHPATWRFWQALHYFLKRVVRTRRRIVFGKLIIELKGTTLYIVLPSGRRLAYPEAHIGPGRFPGTEDVIFRDNAYGGWEECQGWRGVFVENVVCGIARDLLAAAMLRLEAAGYPIVLHVHDEAVAEVPKSFGSVEHFVELMTELPPWAAGLPIAAKGWIRQRYAKPSPVSAEPTTAAQPKNRARAR